LNYLNNYLIINNSLNHSDCSDYYQDVQKFLPHLCDMESALIQCIKFQPTSAYLNTILAWHHLLT